MIGGIVLTWIRRLMKVIVVLAPFVFAIVKITTTDLRPERFKSILIIIAWVLILTFWCDIREKKKEEIWHFDGDSKSSSKYKFR